MDRQLGTQFCISMAFQDLALREEPGMTTPPLEEPESLQLTGQAWVTVLDSHIDLCYHTLKMFCTLLSDWI
jgi:hypothetical protein